MKDKSAFFRFYEELNDFLAYENKKVEFAYVFSGNPAIKDIIEAIGVPHSEVDLILANGESVDFKYRLKAGDHISVYPTFEAFDIGKVTRLRSKPLREVKFILDVHLGKLAKYLRLLGFDSLFDTHFQDSEIVSIAKPNRIILTRDIGLLKHSDVTHGYWVRNTNPIKQLKEILLRFDIYTKALPFSRCLECNSPLVDISKDDIIEQLPAKTRQFYQHFAQCKQCKKIYWEGSHYKKMKEFVDNILLP